MTQTIQIMVLLGLKSSFYIILYISRIYKAENVPLVGIVISDLFIFILTCKDSYMTEFQSD
uniref:Uncharacterized protein n=1 Tax=Rhizophora mucronata TaxID=61149 RepID=A0A2P2PM79_RHIMU